MKRFEGLFIHSTVGILLLTALAKLWSAAGHAPILEHPDPLFGLATRHLLVAVAAVELGVAAALFSRINTRCKHLLVVWLGAQFLLYRIVAIWLHPGGACPCLGTVTEKLNLSRNQANWLLWSLVLYLLAGSVSLLVRAEQTSQLADVQQFD